MAEQTVDEIRRLHRAADAAYEPIVPFDRWVPAVVDLAIWSRASGELHRVRDQHGEAVVQAAIDRSTREAAVDTGAIEGLYPAERGLTLSVAMGEVSLDEAERQVGGNFRRNYEAQLAGFELAMDAVSRQTPLSEAMIRQLQETTCAGQGSHVVVTDVGRQEHQLLLGEYKRQPNHVARGDGTVHAFAPVDRVPDEMHLLMGELTSDRFLAAHCVLQAAYAHHALTVIHPFADGNGRVARLLASIWLLRGASIPLWIRAEDRGTYLDALWEADRNRPRPWIDLVTQVSLSLLRDLAATIEFGPAMTDDEVQGVMQTADERLGISSAALTDVVQGLQQALSEALMKALEVGGFNSRRVKCVTGRVSSGAPWAPVLDLPVLDVRVDRDGRTSWTQVSIVATAIGDRLATVRLDWGEHLLEFALAEVHPVVRDDALRRLERLAGAVARSLIEDVARQ